MTEPIKAKQASFLGTKHTLVSQGSDAVLTSVSDPRTSYNRYAVGTTEATTGPHGQLGLFGVVHSPPVVTGLYATEGGRHLVGTALGLAASQTHHRYGEYPVPDTDLSEYSSRILSRFQTHGVSKGASTKVRNVSDFGDAEETIENARRNISALRWEGDKSVKEFTPEEITRGGAFTRNLLRGNRNVSGAQFGGIKGQGELFS